MSLRARWSAICLFLLVALSLPTFVLAQGTTGRILGRVSDPSGAILGNVKVTLVNEGTGVNRDAKTNENGDYDFVEVPVGSYRLEFDLAGFKKNVRRGVNLDINQVITLNTTMQVGATQEVVDVTSEAPLVETTSTQLGTVVNDRAIIQLPLNQRDTYQFLSLQPGVQSQVGADLYYGGSSTGSVSVNGGRGRSNNFNVNGGDANDMFANLPTVQPSPDSVEEFRILTNGFDAEYGRNSGSVVNVVTKSGTNQFHGDLYEFNRNKSLNAKSYLNPSKEPFVLNQFGATIGGPIKKDRTFFFASYDGRRRVHGVSSGSVSLPTAPEAAGDFSDLTKFAPFGGSINDQNVADVLNTRSTCAADIATAQANAGVTQIAPASGVAYSDLFPNNVIPLSCQDPVAVDLLNHYVTPYISQVNSSGSLVTVLNERDRQDQITFRFDHRINDKQNFSAYYYVTDENDFNPFNTFQAAGANMPGFGDTIKQRFQQYNLSHTWTISNSLVNEARFTYMREAQRTFGHSEHTDLVTNSCTSAAAKPYCFTGQSDATAISDQGLSRIGITPGLGPQHEGVPDISVSGSFVIGNNFEGELPQVGNSFQWTDSITKVKGNHTFKFGADARRMRFDQTLYFEVNGYYNYFGTGLNTPGLSLKDGTSDVVPDYLLGLPDQYQQGAAQVENVRATAVYTFAQDSWKIRPNLTLNYGLRWEFNSPLTDIGHHVQTFRPGQSTTVYPCQLSQYSIDYFANQYSFPGATCENTGVFPTGLVVPGDKGVPAGMTQTYYKAFAPRIGIAWSPGKSGKTSIRAGWGMFYNPIEQLVLEQFSAEPPFGGSVLLYNTMFNTPFVAQAGYQIPNGFNPQGGEFTGIQHPVPGQPVDWSIFRPILLFGEFQPNMRTQYSDQYNLTIQHQLAKDLVLQIGYVGSQGHRLLATTDLNRSLPSTCLDIMALANTNGANVSSYGSQATCGPFLEDDQYTITLDPSAPISTFHMPNGTTHALDGSTINFVGIRPYSSPSCQLDGTTCPPDQTAVFSNIFAQDTIANSSYNSLQANLEKRFSHGLQLQAAYTYSKSIDQASSFEDLINPFNPRASRSLSLYDARQRFVISYVYQLPIPKFEGAKGKILNGWTVSGITQFQSGFPVHVQSYADNELTSSIDFSAPGTPDQIAPFHKLDPRKSSSNYVFDPNSFTDNATTAPDATNGIVNCSDQAVFGCYQPSLLGRYGSARRTICCGPGLNNSDFSVQKDLPITETKRFEFRWDVFNIANHTHFFGVDGNTTDGSDFGRAKKVADPRLMQVALKFYF